MSSDPRDQQLFTALSRFHAAAAEREFGAPRRVFPMRNLSEAEGAAIARKELQELAETYHERRYPNTSEGIALLEDLCEESEAEEYPILPEKSQPTDMRELGYSHESPMAAHLANETFLGPDGYPAILPVYGNDGATQREFDGFCRRLMYEQQERNAKRLAERLGEPPLAAATPIRADSEALALLVACLGDPAPCEPGSEPRDSGLLEEADVFSEDSLDSREEPTSRH